MILRAPAFCYPKLPLFFWPAGTEISDPAGPSKYVRYLSNYRNYSSVSGDGRNLRFCERVEAGCALGSAGSLGLAYDGFTGNDYELKSECNSFIGYKKPSVVSFIIKFRLEYDTFYSRTNASVYSVSLDSDFLLYPFKGEPRSLYMREFYYRGLLRNFVSFGSWCRIGYHDERVFVGSLGQLKFYVYSERSMRISIINVESSVNNPLFSIIGNGESFPVKVISDWEKTEIVYSEGGMANMGGSLYTSLLFGINASYTYYTIKFDFEVPYDL
ncbi:MAG: hypothetical protein JSR44_09510 [Spirochaetes bacterium]|nr:hypothetical protein [Spirochaetota bacterium]